MQLDNVGFSRSQQYICITWMIGTAKEYHTGLSQTQANARKRERSRLRQEHQSVIGTYDALCGDCLQQNHGEAQLEETALVLVSRMINRLDTNRSAKAPFLIALRQVPAQPKYRLNSPLLGCVKPADL